MRPEVWMNPASPLTTQLTESPEKRVTVTNPFQAAAAQVSQSAPAASAPVRNAMPIDTSNPFAQSSDLGGGSYVPTPGVEALVGKTVVYIPRSFDANAKDPFDPTGQKTRPQWTADLFVIDGGDLRFWHKQKANPNATPPVPEATVEKVVPNVSPTNPYVCPSTWVSQAAVVPKLTAAADRGQILIGTYTRGAQKAQREKNITDEQVSAEYDAWVARGKSGPEVKFVWLLADVTPDGMKNVQAWWAANKDTIKL